MNLTLPGYNYLGPGNPINAGEPVNKTDSIARDHDVAYSRAQSHRDIFEADWEAIKHFSAESVRSPTLLGPKLGVLGLGSKTLFERAIGRTVYGLGKTSMQTPTKRGANNYDSDSGFGPSPSKMAASTSAMPAANVGDVNMDNNETGGITAAGAATPGMGGGAGAGTSLMFAGDHQKQEWDTRTFKKTYRFFHQASLPSVENVPSLVAQNNYIRFKPGSMIALPVHYVFAYLSPGEYELMQQFPQVKIQHVRCKVSSEGVRLPFTTQEAAAVTANASAQIPIFKMSKAFGDAYLINYDATQILNVRQQMTGSAVFGPTPWPVTTPNIYTNIFPNLSARATSRNITMDPIIAIPRPIWVDALGGRQPVNDNMMWGDPSIHEFKEIVLNGTTNLGPVFEYEYKPRNNTLCARTTVFARRGFFGSASGSGNDAGGNNSSDTAMGLGKINYVSGQGTAGNPVNTTGLQNIRDFGMTMMPAYNAPYETAQVENPLSIDAHHEYENHRQPHFIIGQDFLRNADSTLLNSNWEFLVEFEMVVSVRMKTTGVYDIFASQFPSQHLYPNWVPGSYGNTGMGLTPEVLGARMDSHPYSNTMWWNKPAITMPARTNTDLQPQKDVADKEIEEAVAKRTRSSRLNSSDVRSTAATTTRATTPKNTTQGPLKVTKKTTKKPAKRTNELPISSTVERSTIAIEPEYYEDAEEILDSPPLFTITRQSFG